MYKLRARFTTLDGSLDPNGQPYSITAEALQRFRSILPEGVGCATCIFVRLEGGPSREVFFETTGGHHETHELKPDGWAHTSMANPGSGYNPNSNRGPWSVQAVGAPSTTVDDIGLPFGHHVTHFIILTWDESGEDMDEGPEPAEPPAGQPPHIQVYIDGVLVFDNAGAG